MTTGSQFGAHIRKLRLDLGLSLRKAASQMNIGHMRLDELERGFSRTTGRPTHPRRELVAAIADVYRVPTDALLEMAGYAREKRPLSFDEQLVLDMMRRMDDHHRTLVIETITAIDRIARLQHAGIEKTIKPVASEPTNGEARPAQA